MRSSEALLNAHLRRNRIGHTYLLTGADGDEKTTLALSFARGLNCLQEKAFERCECLSCRKIEKGNHPDVQWFGEEKTARSIKIEEIREMLHWAALKPFEGRWKVFILKGAERLTLEASNALLKTLEEPPEHSVFLLLVSHKAHLPETIQSRAFEIRVPPSPQEKRPKSPWAELVKEKGWDEALEKLQAVTRPEVREVLEDFLFYVRDEALLAWQKKGNSEAHLEAMESLCEAQEALAANANQKLTLTHLQIRVGKLFSE